MAYSWMQMIIFAVISAIPSAWYVYLKLKGKENRWQLVSFVLWLPFLFLWGVELWGGRYWWNPPILIPITMFGGYIPLIVCLMFCRKEYA